MIAVEQEFPHDPERGVFGDCMRACFASILELPIKDVPHFMHDGDPDRQWCTRINSFLRQYGLCLMSFHAKDWNLEELLIQSDVPELYHIISGPSPRFPGLWHATVGKNGMIVHDPHPDKSGLSGNPEEWQYEFLINLGMGQTVKKGIPV